MEGHTTVVQSVVESKGKGSFHFISIYANIEMRWNLWEKSTSKKDEQSWGWGCHSSRTRWMKICFLKTKSYPKWKTMNTTDCLMFFNVMTTVATVGHEWSVGAYTFAIVPEILQLIILGIILIGMFEGILILRMMKNLF
jgi:hypothetical protein